MTANVSQGMHSKEGRMLAPNVKQWIVAMQHLHAIKACFLVIYIYTLSIGRRLIHTYVHAESSKVGSISISKLSAHSVSFILTKPFTAHCPPMTVEENLYSPLWCILSPLESDVPITGCTKVVVIVVFITFFITYRYEALPSCFCMWFVGRAKSYI